MALPGGRRFVAAAAVAWFLAGTACTDTGADHQLLDRFFAASRLRDRTALARLSTVILEPSVDGMVERFEVVSTATLDAQTRQLTVQAQIRGPNELVTERRLAVTITRAEAASLATASTGWVVTAIR